ncbi:alpha/beta fold hydrolase [Trinickia mobilis]|uniref:alpha/beta fold hydrolase n=1 Tax=Trinickia mobilis TaxID=2816356 RepID=UPI001A8C268D|nr:alpha/beta hydrolase [Trinickia mobilis]
MDVKICGRGPALVVAVHGIQGTRKVWEPVAGRLDGEATFVLPNLRGRGGAPRGACVADYQLRCFADDLGEVIDSCVAGREYWLAGWSMGVSVSLEYLSRAGAHQPSGVILASGTPAVRNVAWFQATGRAALMDEIGARERKLKLGEAADHDAVAWTWEAIRDTDQTAILPSIAIPTHVVHGAADDQCPLECAHMLASAIRGSTVKILGGGHSLPVTHASAISTLLRDVLSRQV